MRGLSLVLLVLAGAACARISIVEPLITAPLDATFTLRINQEADIEGTPLRIRFVSVPADSRCPVDVACVWAGDARVRLLVEASGSVEQPMELHTALEPRSEAFGGYRVRLHHLEPAPRSEVEISQDRYAASLQVSRAP